MARGQLKNISIARSLVRLFVLCWACGIVQSAALAQGQGLIQQYVREARQSGKASIRIPYPIVEWAELESVPDAIAHTTLVVARLVESETVRTNDEIVTWRKYAILEKLSKQLTVPTGLCEDIPRSLLPLKPTEFVVPEIGGTVEVDGVTVVQQDPRKNDIPAQDRHLMFLLFVCSGSIALLNYGPYGHFSLDDSDLIHISRYSQNNALKDDLLARTGGRLSSLRAISAQITPRSLQDRR